LALAAATALVLASVAAATTGTHAVSATITVTFTDRSLKATPSSPSAGTTTFVVVNRGKRIHRLLIKGPGIKGVQSVKLTAGHSAKLEVRLKAGAYSLSDPVGLGDFAAFFLDVVPATTVSAKGNDSTVQPQPTLPPMCGAVYTP
jgi:hypothetical protein